MRNEGNAIEGLLFDKEYEGRKRPSSALDVVYLSQQELLQLFWDHEDKPEEKTKGTGVLKNHSEVWDQSTLEQSTLLLGVFKWT